ncbi:GNAT family N-acetyltransferase [Rhizobium sp. CC-YZS058]|uniref:GNAT family N-acetyltransferase n=1 Tax=Rhizobium sp. CC-YZS058 TaxID=3042153 RepID=UPI002B056413|nr:GNAT family N-acetyltransferase [Rhizobium sp. CC-YZS058]MEA3533832.1 GNAT family N-acetyltransferase [Rhizobium sp. CC-YZS058]
MPGQAAAPTLPAVRRLEAVGFRAWPAADIHYDGSWLVRLTPGHGSRRLNSVNPLDPFDCGDLEGRLARAGRRFATAGRPLTLRQTPLTPPSLVAYLDGAGWSRFAETIVMTGEIPPHEAGETVEHLPLRDLARFAEARLAISGEPPESASTLLSILEAIKPECGLFLFEERGFGPTAVAMAVHDSDLLGINQVAVHAQRRRAGLGTALLSACLRWGRLKGARQAWLAVEAANAPARALYEGFGFRETYRYVYRQPKDHP